jgi:hypothetical protein
VRGKERKIGNHNFLLLTSQIATAESRNVTLPPNPREALKKKKKNRAAPEAQSY